VKSTDILIMIIYSKFCQNHSDFYSRCYKTFWLTFYWTRYRKSRNFHDCQVSHGSETLFRWGGKHYN